MKYPKFLQKGEIMIDKVSFAGREILLTKNLAKNLAKAAEVKFVRASSYLGDTSLGKVTEVQTPKVTLNSLYSNPFAPVELPKAVKTANLGEGVGNNLHFFG